MVIHWPPAYWTSVPKELYCADIHAIHRHSGCHAMSPLEQLFILEVEFRRKLRTDAPGTGDAAAIHTSYALQSGYEQLLKRVGRITATDIEALRERMSLAGDARDVLNARDSAMKILGIRPLAT